MKDKTFDALPPGLQVAEVDRRLRFAVGRISTVKYLRDFIGDSIFLVISPWGQTKFLGNAYIYKWNVAGIITVKGTSSLRFCCTGSDSQFKVSHANHAIALKDFNVVPNNHNNHAAFAEHEDAMAYAMARKIRYSDYSHELDDTRDEFDYWMNDWS